MLKATRAPSQFAHAAMPCLGAGLGYFLLAVTAIGLLGRPGALAMVWFANAWAAVFIVTSLRAHWLPMAAAVMVASIAADMLNGHASLHALAFLPAKGAEIALGAWLMWRSDAESRCFESLQGFLETIVVGALIPPLAGATVAAMLIWPEAGGGFTSVWSSWYFSGMIGAAAMLPLAFALRRLGLAGSRSQLLSRGSLALMAAVVAITLVAIADLQFPFALIAMPLLVAAVIASLPVILLGCMVAVLTISAGLSLASLSPSAVAMPWAPMQIYLPIVAMLLPVQLIAVAIAALRKDNESQNASRLRYRQLEASLDEERRQLSALTSATEDPASFIDADYRYRLVNRACERYWERPRDTVLGRLVVDVVGPEVFARSVKPALDAAMAGETVRFRASLSFPDVGDRMMDVSYQPARDGPGRVIGVIVVAHDVHDLVESSRQLQKTVAQLEQTNADLAQFVRITSHDLREPLNTVTQFCSLIEADHGLALGEPARLYFSLVLRGASRMKTMLDDLLQFAQLDREPGPTQPVALDQVLADVREALGARIAISRARIEVLPLPMVQGHVALLRILFQNLLANATKFVPPTRTPHVTVAAQVDAGRVVIAITDNGIGVAIEDVPRMFEPFRRLNTRRHYEGTGLGLAICKRIVDAHGGDIWVKSRPGFGSTFQVALPAADGP